MRKKGRSISGWDCPDQKPVTISIITVCYNAERVIGRTIRSVMEQTYPHLEYLMIDGASTDGTEALVRPYAERGELKWYSEPDHGIYDAMNKGAAKATGDYLYFLNAGDILFDAGVMERMAARCQPSRAEVLYGSITYVHPDGHTEKRIYGSSCGSLIYYLTGDCINHQAILAHRACFEDKPFDTEHYRICADRDWMLRLKKRKIPFVCTGEMMVYYSLAEDSASIRNKGDYQREAKYCIRKHLPLGYPMFALFEFCRSSRVLSKLLHGVYRVLYIRKKS